MNETLERSFRGRTEAVRYAFHDCTTQTVQHLAGPLFEDTDALRELFFSLYPAAKGKYVDSAIRAIERDALQTRSLEPAAGLLKLPGTKSVLTSAAFAEGSITDADPSILFPADDEPALRDWTFLTRAAVGVFPFSATADGNIDGFDGTFHVRAVLATKPYLHPGHGLRQIFVTTFCRSGIDWSEKAKALMKNLRLTDAVSSRRAFMELQARVADPYEGGLPGQGKRQ